MSKFKDAKRTSFAVGDKVKLLPSIVCRNILESEVGKIGIIIGVFLGSYSVKTDRYTGWFVLEEDVAPAIVKGQQLLFEFMSEETSEKYIFEYRV